MTLYSDTQVHRDHCQWTQERALWHDDLRIWEEQIDEIRAKLTRLETALAQHKHDLQVHAATVTIYQERDGRREHALARYERDGNEERVMLVDQAHEGEIRQHQRQRERHEEIKASHRRLMAEFGAITALANRLPPAVAQSS